MIRYACAAVAALLTCAPAGAATVNVGFGIHGRDWQRVGSETLENVLVGTIDFSGVFFLTSVDPTSDFTRRGVEASFNYVAFPSPTYILKYTAATDTMQIFGEADGEGFSTTQNDLYAEIQDVFTAQFPTGVEIRISSANSPGGYWQAQRVYAGVPEPATWAMMIGGFGLLGVATRRQRRAAFA